MTLTRKLAPYFHDGPGQDYADQRYYNPQMGAFWSPDPSGFTAVDPSNPATWNKYTYSGGDPVNFYDPNGLFLPVPPDGPVSISVPPGIAMSACALFPAAPGCPMSWALRGKPNPSGHDILLDEWNNLSEDCQNALKSAMPGQGDGATISRVQAINRAASEQPILETAVAGTNVDWTLLAAIGVKETGFRNITQPDGNGVGIFQIDLGKNPQVSSAQAMTLGWAAGWAANSLSTNMTALQAAYPGLDSATLLQATAASYNHGLTGVERNLNAGRSPDAFTTGGNYGATVRGLMDCFQ